MLKASERSSWLLLSATLAQFALLLIAALSKPQLGPGLHLNEIRAAIWATTVMLMAAMVLAPYSAWSRVIANLSGLYWTALRASLGQCVAVGRHGHDRKFEQLLPGEVDSAEAIFALRALPFQRKKPHRSRFHEATADKLVNRIGEFIGRGVGELHIAKQT